MYDLLTHLLNEEISTIKAAKKQNELLDKIEDVKDFILLEEKNTIQGIKKAKTKAKSKKKKNSEQKCYK